jgi:protein-tyrosine-phosphatase
MIESTGIESKRIVLMETLEKRAEKFAALSEPARLWIVDLLVLGDLSPTEIQFALGMSSNLVAHHLRVLEAAGILARSRSEHDGRRSYVRLVPGAFDRLAADPLDAPSRVMFVSTANSARSQLAEVVWRQVYTTPTGSAGTRPADRVDPLAVTAAQRHGLVIPDERPRLFSEVLREDDFVVTVCDRAHEELGGRDDQHWSIPDPAPIGTDAAFDVTLADIRHRATDLASRLRVG